MKYPKEFWKIYSNVNFPTDTDCIVAVSGGPDSVLAACLAKEKGIKFAIVHINYGFRKESNDEQLFVENLAQKLGARLYVYNYPHSRLNGNKSLQEDCRHYRFEKFKEVGALVGTNVVVTGHNLDDSVETLLHTLCKGRNGRPFDCLVENGENNGMQVFRPLIHWSKSEIVEALDSINQSYMIDSSNLGCKYDRNKLRNIILPELREMYGGLDEILFEKINEEKERQKIVEQHLEQVVKKIVFELYGGYCVDIAKYFETEYAEMALKQFLRKLGFRTDQFKEIFKFLKPETKGGFTVKLNGWTIHKYKKYLSIQSGY